MKNKKNKKYRYFIFPPSHVIRRSEDLEGTFIKMEYFSSATKEWLPSYHIITSGSDELPEEEAVFYL